MMAKKPYKKPKHNNSTISREIAEAAYAQMTTDLLRVGAIVLVEHYEFTDEQAADWITRTAEAVTVATVAKAKAARELQEQVGEALATINE